MTTTATKDASYYRTLEGVMKTGISKLTGNVIVAVACKRCGGSGHYSFCPMYGTICFECDGRRVEWVEGNTYERRLKARVRRAAKRQREWEAGAAERERQAAARIERDRAREAAKEARVQTRRDASNHVGEVGERLDLTLTLVYDKEIVSQWGISYLTKWNDASGNEFTWFASNYPCQDNQPIERGQSVQIRATVKDHQEYQGVKQTVITRGKVA